MKVNTGFSHQKISLIMKRGLILLMAFCLGLVYPLRAGTVHPDSSAFGGNNSLPSHTSSIDQLRKEVSAFFKSQDLTFLKKNVEVIRVSFLINAKNELVISNVEGEDPDACDYVKRTLNFKRVNYAPAKQLAKYAVDIRLVSP
jgi:hypothetical protein